MFQAMIQACMLYALIDDKRTPSASMITHSFEAHVSFPHTNHAQRIELKEKSKAMIDTL